MLSVLLLFLGLWWCPSRILGTLALSVQNPIIIKRASQRTTSSSFWQRPVVYDDNEDSPNSSAIIPAGEEALHSARMARSIRKFRTTRGLVKETETTDKDRDKESIMESRGNLLLAPNRKQPKPPKKSAALIGWKETAKTRTNLIKKQVKPKTKPKTEAFVKTERLRRSNGMDLPYQSTIKALREYYKLHGDLVMPRRYCVPDDEAYPREWHGVDLASTVYDMKWWQNYVKQKPDRVEELNKMGFLWERLQPEWNLVLEALITYSELHGDVVVPGAFVVPTGDKYWPKATWGIPLGNCVYRIRHRSDFLRGSTAESRRDQLDGLGFVWDVQEYRFLKAYAALKHFALIEGHDSSSDTASTRNTALRVPSSFVVPKTEAWPEELWGYPLGAKCTAIRQKQLYVKSNPRRQQLLESLRFQWSGNASLGWLEVVHAAAIYSKLHHRHLDVPFDFKVPPPPSDADPHMRVDTSTAADDDGGVWPWPGTLTYMNSFVHIVALRGFRLFC